MTALTAEQLAIYRRSRQWAEPLLYIDAAPIVFQARVNQATFTYPIALPITWDTLTQGAAVNCEVGMLIVFGSTAGADDRGRTTLSGINATQIFIPRTSRGVEDGTVNLADNAWITIYNFFPLVAEPPYIDEDLAVTYKKSVRAFEELRNPIANLGHGCVYAAEVDPATNLITLALNSVTSFATHPGATIASRLWTVGDGSYQSGTSTSTAPVVTFPVGRRYIKLQVTDSNSRNCIRRLLVAALPVGGAIRKFKVGSLPREIDGQAWEFEILQDIPTATYLDGFAVCLFVNEYYGDQRTNLGQSTVKFSGFHHTGRSSTRRERTHVKRNTTIRVLDVLQKLATMPTFPQIIEHNPDPMRWEEQDSPNIDSFLVNLWQWQSNASDHADFIWSGVGSTYPFVRLGSDGQNLYDQIDGRALAIGYRMISDSLGVVKIKKDSMLHDSRDATNTIDLAENDWISLGWTDQRPTKIHWTRGYAVLASSTIVDAVMAIAPGEMPSQGTGSRELNEALVTSMTEWCARLGHHHRRDTAEQGYFEIELLRGNDIGLEVLDFVRLTMTEETAAHRGLEFTDQRFMIASVNQVFNDDAGAWHVRLRLEKEVFGVPAQPKYPEADTTDDFETDLFPIDSLVIDNTFDLHKGVKDLAAFGTDGSIYRTHTFTRNAASGGPEWDSAASGVSGTPIQVVPDAASPKYLGTGSQVNAWVATTTGIYKVSSIEGTPSAALQKSLRATSSKRSMDFSFGSLGYGVCVSAYSDGVYETHTSDGTTWSTETLVGAATDLDAFSPGVYMSSKSLVAYLTAVVSGVGDGYKGTLPSPSFARLGTPNVNPGNELAGEIHVPFAAADENTAYFGQSPGSFELIFNFAEDDGGWEVLDLGIETTGTRGQYTAGVGWEDDYFTHSPSGTSYRDCHIVYEFGGTVTLTEVIVTYALTPGENAYQVDGSQGNSARLWYGGSPTSSGTIFAVESPATPTTLYWSGSQSTDTLHVECWPGFRGNPDLADPGGTSTITSVIVRGTGLATGRKLIRVEGTTQTDISPDDGTDTYGPWQSRGQVVSDATNAQLMAFALATDDLSLAGIWVSNNRGDTMQTVVEPEAAGSRYERVAISSDGNGVVYLMGEDGQVAYMNSLDSTPDERGPGGSPTMIAVMGI
jgi:hypothetical protein